MNAFVPAQPFPPGEYIQDELDAREWTIDDLAAVTGISRRQINNLIQAKAGITPGTAIALAEAFDQEPQTWMNLQVAYELAMAAQQDRGIARRAKIFKKVPVREMQRRNWLAPTATDDELEKEVCRFLEIPSIDAEPNLAIAAKKSDAYDADTQAQVAWYSRCRDLAKGVPAAKYSDANWRGGVDRLLLLANEPENVRQVPKTLADMGIRLVVVQPLRHTKIDGVALWLDEHSPVIGMSLRFDRIDNFWFVLMHELIHVKYRDASPVDVDLHTDPSLPAIEQRANAEASDCLIPTERLDSFISRVHPHYYQEKIVQFAAVRKVHPGIVVGQLQGRGKLKYHQLRKLLVNIRAHIAGNAITDGWDSALQGD